MSKYQLPPFLVGLVDQARYAKWLQAKARAHCKRDRERGNSGAALATYRAAIHAAVAASDGIDAYTGRALRWDLIGTYDNSESRSRRRAYKHDLAELPTIDHIGDGLGAPDFAICGWRVNDAKHDLSYEHFVQVCRDVLAHYDASHGSTD